MRENTTLDNNMNTIPNLPFSVDDMGDVGMNYLGTTTKGTALFFYGRTKDVFKWNVHSKRFRAQGWDRQYTLRRGVEPDEVLGLLQHFSKLRWNKQERRLAKQIEAQRLNELDRDNQMSLLYQKEFDLLTKELKWYQS